MGRPPSTRRKFFNDRTYPRYTRLLAELGVESQPSDMSFSVSCAKSGLEYNGSSLNTLFAQRENLVRGAFWRMLGDILRFNREAPRLLEEEGGEMGLGEYLERGGYGSQLRDYYILPMGAAIWSTDPARMLAFPARLFVRFFVNHGLLSMRDRPVWRVIRDGSRTHVERLIAPFRDRIPLRTPVLGVTRHDERVDLHLASGTVRFDALFLACHSDQALALLNDPTGAEREVLSAIPYQANEAVLHTDTRQLPRRCLARASWNYLMPMDVDYRCRMTLPGERLAVHMEDVQGERTPLDATLMLKRRPINGSNLARALVRYPFMTGQVIFDIHWQALRLWLKGTPIHDHPAPTPAERERTA